MLGLQSWSSPWSMRHALLLAIPLFLMLTPARAFIGAALGSRPRQPFGAKRLLRHGRRRLGGQLRSLCATSSGGKDEDGCRGKVIVIAGPTATGKSSIAMELCKRIGGEIVSADSVQVYRNLNIGANKPSAEERHEVPHHLVDITRLEHGFSAGEYVDAAYAALDDIMSRGRVPVVVGGTMMYLQWLVDGSPNAPKKDTEVAKEVASELRPLQESGEWEAALKLLSDVNPARAEAIIPNDWYRLSRSLEIVRTSGGRYEFTGERSSSCPGKYDFRCFFLVGDRLRMFQEINRRCEDMLVNGLLQEVAGLLIAGKLNPESSPGRSIGYRQAIDYLCAEPLPLVPSCSSPPLSSGHCGKDLAHPAAAAATAHFNQADQGNTLGQGLGSGSGSVLGSGLAPKLGLEGLGATQEAKASARVANVTLAERRARAAAAAELAKAEEAVVARYLDFFRAFAGKTRRYAVDQLKWHRSSKGGAYSWEVWGMRDSPVDVSFWLGDKVQERRRMRKARDKRISAQAGGGAGAGGWMPLPLPRNGEPLCGDGRGSLDVLETIERKVAMTEGEFEAMLG
ncbi:unnamed protein product, partial [Discosporangium mesarthrocarpum]